MTDLINLKDYSRFIYDFITSGILMSDDQGLIRINKHLNQEIIYPSK